MADFAAVAKKTIEAPHADWVALAAEFDCWRAAGRVAPLWWRDDDAIRPTPQLNALLQLAEGIPLALAVVPALAEPALADLLRPMPAVSVMQHGWRHHNHAGSGKKCEYPPGRAADEVALEIAAGRATLLGLFGERALPVFVPPWNRFAAELAPLLARAGILGFSAMIRREGTAPAGLVAIDAHIDLVAWRSGRRFIGETAVLSQLVAGFRAMRTGALAAPAIGILTHHAVMDPGTAAFLGRLTRMVAGEPAARWAHPGEFLS